MFRPQDTAIFPEKGSSSPAVRFRLWQVKRQLQKRDTARNLGSLYTLPHPAAIESYTYFLDQNPNHLGNWSSKPPRYATHQLEYEVIQSMIGLYKAERERLEGYITTGGTEGNIFSAWLGRSYLEEYCKKEAICLLKTSLTHYSVRKAGDVCDIPQYLVPLDQSTWSMHIAGLEETVSRLYTNGVRGFLLPLTLGYTSTGTCDDIDAVTHTVEQLHKHYKNTRFFLWIDAALNGLITPFISDFRPLRSPLIQTIMVDFHKFGLVPFPASIVLYRKTLKKLVEQPIDYLSETDATLSGSRSGIPAANIWMMIHTLGKSGYRQIAEEQRGNKQFFIESILALFPKIRVITHPDSLSCGLIFQNLRNNRLPLWVEEKYSLYPGKTRLLFYPKEEKEEVIYKCFFLPHMKRSILTKFLDDIIMENK